ncbi:hypothetical protein [Novipirellula aureliae]|uniref:hypothetical protein n=1 Tax=Novipirellula aureliae TaxID=2527966 RepID=UPI0011B7699A|nr:hypothetical protein [Novipirellula aureliae]
MGRTIENEHDRTEILPTSPVESPAPGDPATPDLATGCRWKSCLTVSLVLLILIGCGGVGGYWYYVGQLEKYTATAPVVIPTVEYAPEQIQRLEAEIETFRQSIEREQPEPPDLVLSANQINALIARHPELKGRVHLDILDDKMVGDVSFPTDALPGGEGRFFNAKVTFDLAIEDRLLRIRLEEATVNGEAVPDSVLEAMDNQNFTSEINRNPNVAHWMGRFESLTIKDGKVFLKPKPPEPAESTKAGVEDLGIR